MDLLSDILSHMKLEGTLYFRTSFTGKWGVKVPAYGKVARFHFAHRGRCMVKIERSNDTIALEQGDLLIVPRGAAHKLYSDAGSESCAAELDTVLQDSGFEGTGTLVYGEPGNDHETQLICGHFSFTDSINHPLIEQLPASILLRNYGEISGAWMEQTLRVIGKEAGTEEIGSSIISLKLSEIIFVQALRAYLSESDNVAPGLKGFADKRIAKSLQAIHLNPDNNWTLEELASVAGMSRTAYTGLFGKLMNMTPLKYVTQWRMQVAREKLLESNSAIITIAEATGYQSEAAFSRVFKKYFDQTPAAYRRQHRINRQLGLES